MRRGALTGLIASLAIATSACSLLTSLDGLSSGDALTADGDAGAERSTDASNDATAASDTRATTDALDAGDEAGPNLHPQPTFENGTCFPWVGYQGTVEAVTTAAHSGIRSCRACTNPGTTNFFTVDDNGSPGPGELGATYHAEAWVRTDPTAPAPAGARLFFRQFAIVGGMFTELESSTTAQVPIDATWKHFETTLTLAKPGGKMNVFVGAPAAPGVCFLLDDVALRKVN